MKVFKTIKSLHKYMGEHPDTQAVYVTPKLHCYLTQLEEEYVAWLLKNIPMKKKHKEDYQLFNDCIPDSGLSIKVKL